MSNSPDIPQGKLIQERSTSKYSTSFNITDNLRLPTTQFRLLIDDVSDSRLLNRDGIS